MHRLLPTRWGLSILEALLLLAFVVAVCYGVQKAWPYNGVVQGIHAFWNFLAQVCWWIAKGINAFGDILNQL